MENLMENLLDDRKLGGKLKVNIFKIPNWFQSMWSESLKFGLSLELEAVTRKCSVKKVFLKLFAMSVSF